MPITITKPENFAVIELSKSMSKLADELAKYVHAEKTYSKIQKYKEKQINITQLNCEVEELEESSFHRRQVPALQRQSKAIQYIRTVREQQLCPGSGTLGKKAILDILDRIQELLLSS